MYDFDQSDESFHLGKEDRPQTHYHFAITQDETSIIHS